MQAANEVAMRKLQGHEVPHAAVMAAAARDAR